MNQQQINSTERRIQASRDHSYLNGFGSPKLIKIRGRSNPEHEVKSYLRPGKLYLRSTNLDQKRNYYSIETDMSRIDEEVERTKLPKIKRMKLVSIGHNDHKHTFNSPTISSKVLFDGKKSPYRNYQNKRICSVNCMSQEQRMKKLKKMKDQSRYKRCSTVNEDYKQDNYKSKYPTNQLRDYLSRMRNRSKDKEEEESEIIEHTTYFGLQPQFYKLQTQYVRQMYEPQRDVSGLEHYRPVTLPSVPSREDIPDFIQNYISVGKEINLQQLYQQRNFLVEYTSTEIYFGQMQGGQKQGLGVLLSEKICFEGIFKENQKLKGVELTNSGIYRGEFFRGKKEGNGQYEWINGEYYVGDWKEGLRHGKGVWTNKKGESYNGQWVKGRGQGYGIYISEGKQYHGDFLDFKKDGWGRQKLSNGDEYQGGFKEGQPEGKGSYVWVSGTRYQGQFLHGFRNGKGILTTLDGYVYNGQFIDEKPQGLCEILVPNGDTYQGYLRNGKKNGRGLLMLNKGKKSLDGYWQNDRFVGPANDF